MRSLFIALLCIGLGACAANPLMKADQPLSPLDEKIAADTANQLARLYPPAKTQFNVVASAPRGFGALLAGKLRAKGYAVTESRPTDQAGIGAVLHGDVFSAVFPPKSSVSAADDKTQAQAKPADDAGIELRYVLDHAPAADFSRVTLKIGRAVLARAYLSHHGAIAPAGAWTYKE